MSQRGSAPHTAAADLVLRLLGPMRVLRGASALRLPASRKARALLAYLALSPRPVGRSQLCELLWEAPDDPRGELRWCLSRLRAALDGPGGSRLIAVDDTLALDLDACRVDALELLQAAQQGIDRLTAAQQQALLEQIGGDFLEGLELDDSPAFTSWMTAQRRRLRNAHVALLEQTTARLAPEPARAPLEAWLQLAPFDRRAHERLLAALAGAGRMRDGEEHVRAAAALFEAEGLDGAVLRKAWDAARAAASGSCPPAPAVRVLDTIPGLDAGVQAGSRRASVAVMPLRETAAAPGQPGGTAEALAHDLTTRLCKLRSLFVIAQGSTFALHQRAVGPEEAGRMLDVDYVLGGTLQRFGRRLHIGLELVETRSARIAWSETLDVVVDDTLLALDEIGDRVVAAVAGEIEALERNRALLKPPNSLDAWESHHRGLWHMYRFTQADNAQAQHFFAAAVRLDPTFARAYAGLSFTHFQSAFQGWGERAAESDRAFAAAGQALMADDRDPAAHWSMGRAIWLRGGHDNAVDELRQSVALSPNFALGHYALAFVESQTGDPQEALSRSAASQALSPFDPLLFAVLGARAMALARLGRYDEAAREAVRAATRPNAHPHISAIAAYTLALANQPEEARSFAAALHRARPGYSVEDFLATFRFADEDAGLFREAARRI